MSDFKNLNVWRKSHALALSTFRVCSQMRGTGSTILRNQVLRSSISVPANIAEGSAKQSDAEFVRFLRIALGSLTECEYHFILARDVDLISSKNFTKLNDDLASTRKMLSGLINALNRQSRKPREKPTL